MANQDVKLVSMWCSPFGKRCEWALKLKGVQYEYIEEDLANKSSMLLEINPVYKMVPVLVHGGKPMSESPVILEYIDQVWPQNPILPQDPYERAQVRFWTNFIEEKLTFGSIGVLSTEGEEQVTAIKLFEDAMTIFEGEAKAKKGKFFGGESMGHLDIVLGWSSHWLGAVDEISCQEKLFDAEKYPSYAKWMEDFKALPLIRENLPPRHRVIEYLTNALKMMLASKA